VSVDRAVPVAIAQAPADDCRLPREQVRLRQIDHFVAAATEHGANHLQAEPDGPFRRDRQPSH